MLIYFVIISIQILSFFLIFKEVSDYSFSKKELWGYPTVMLVLGWFFSQQFGVWGALFFFLLFVGIGWQKERSFSPIILFYALYALLMNSFLGYLVAQPMEWLFSYFSFLSADKAQNLLYLAVALAPPVINSFIWYVIGRCFPDFSMGSLKQSSGWSLMVVMGFLYSILMLENQRGENSWQHNLIVMGLFIVMVLSLLMLQYYFQKQQKLKIQELQEAQLSQLQDYTQQIEGLYNEISQFRHDYVNILTSLEEGIYSQDIQQIQQVYESVVKPTKQAFQANHYSFGRLSQILVPEIKSLMGAKLILAQQKQIDCQIEVVEPISTFHFELVSLVRIISILLDNAIEAAVLTPKPWLKVAIFEEEDLQYILIENSCQDPVAIKKITKKGYSSKGLNRGLGLYNVQQLLSESPYASLETSNLVEGFSQVLRLKKEDSRE